MSCKQWSSSGQAVVNRSAAKRSTLFSKRFFRHAVIDIPLFRPVSLRLTELLLDRVFGQLPRAGTEIVSASACVFPIGHLPVLAVARGAPFRFPLDVVKNRLPCGQQRQC